jgi:hypothetical protein
LEIRNSDTRHITVGAENRASGKTDKPADADTIEYAWSVLPSPPTDQSELGHTHTTRKSAYVLEFSEAERGKTVYMAARYKNEKGDAGPWGDIISAIIP